MARLNPKEWARLREAWESDERKSFGWVAEELHVSVSRPAITKRAKAEGWQKGENLRPAPKKVPKPRPEKPKKDPKVTAKLRKMAQKIDGTNAVTNNPLVTKSSAATEVINNSALSETEQLFVLEYLKDFNASAAAVRTGLGGKAPEKEGYKLLRKPRVQGAVRDAVTTRANAIGVDGDRLMQLWTDIVSFDTNELVEFRRVPCPWCYAKDGQPQMTISRYYAEKKKHEQARERMLLASKGTNDIGEYPSALLFDFVDTHMPPNPDCKVCHGDGDEMRLMKDTRKLSARAKMMYCGVEETKGSFNFVTLDKERAIDNLAKALFLFREKDEELDTSSVRAEDLTKRFNETMARAQRKQEAAYRERGINDDDVIDVWPKEDENGAEGS